MKLDIYKIIYLIHVRLELYSPKGPLGRHGISLYFYVSIIKKFYLKFKVTNVLPGVVAVVECTCTVTTVHVQ